MKTQYFNKNGIIAPNHFVIDNKAVFTNDERIYNEQGYYERIYTECPQDEKAYNSKFELQDNKLIQIWYEIKESEIGE